MTQEKSLSILGWVATATAMAMYVSYIPQISSNLAGHHFWLYGLCYGFLKISPICEDPKTD